MNFNELVTSLRTLLTPYLGTQANGGKAFFVENHIPANTKGTVGLACVVNTMFEFQKLTQSSKGEKNVNGFYSVKLVNFDPDDRTKFQTAMLAIAAKFPLIGKPRFVKGSETTVATIEFNVRVNGFIV